MLILESKTIWVKGFWFAITLIVFITLPFYNTYAQDSDSEEEFEVKERLVIENFEEPLGFPFEIYESEKGKAELEDGQLILEAYTDSGMSRYIEFDMPANPDEIIMQARMKLTKGNLMGLIFLFENWDNYGWVLFNALGEISLGFVKNGKTYYIARNVPTFSFFANEFNDIKIKQSPTSFKIYLNGYVEITERAIPLEGNQFGFIVGGHSGIAVDEFGLGYVLILKKEEGGVAARFFGSGLILDSFHVITAYHVVQKSQKVHVTVINNHQEVANMSAKILFKDENLDIAILKTDSPLPVPFPVPYSIKREGILSLGSYVYALGYPLIHAGMGTSIKFQDGKISAKTGYENDPSQYQTTIPGAPGYSGGPVFDENGNLIGILTAKHKIAENASYVVKASSFSTLLDLVQDLSLPKQTLLHGKSISEQTEILSPYVVIVKVQ